MSSRSVKDASLNGWTDLRHLSIVPLLRHLVIVGALPLIVSMVGFVASFSSAGGRIFFVKVIIVVLWGVLGSFFLHEYCHLLVARELNAAILAKWEVRVLRISLLETGERVLSERAIIAAAGPGVTFAVGSGLIFFCHLIRHFSIFSIAVEDVIVIVGIGHVLHILYLLPVFSDGRMILDYVVARFHRRV